jgi:outer membrane receptor for ferrienterochelin and colicins
VNRHILTYVFLAITCSVFGQDDSSYFKMYEPSFDDLNPNPELQENNVISYSRRATKLIDAPANVYIIEQQEILENGYLTLVDVLENILGIQTSQPGNSLNGELFMIRGLLGNYYCKILINGISVQPSGVGGMPIRAQLPIRQAEKIEVVFGPSLANYGGDAMAGVINIITKNTSKSSVI